MADSKPATSGNMDSERQPSDESPDREGIDEMEHPNTDSMGNKALSTGEVPFVHILNIRLTHT